ncbi:DNA topoisomerase 3-alpha [Bienertia sinuspersici]
MVTQNSAGSASFSASRSRSRGSTGAIEPVKCYHNEVALLRTVRFNGPTQGKRTCGFFKWVDEVDTVNELQFMVFERDTIISELEYEKELLEADVKKLRKKGEELQDQVNELAMENTRNGRLQNLLGLIGNLSCCCVFLGCFFLSCS